MTQPETPNTDKKEYFYVLFQNLPGGWPGPGVYTFTMYPSEEEFKKSYTPSKDEIVYPGVTLEEAKRKCMSQENALALIMCSGHLSKTPEGLLDKNHAQNIVDVVCDQTRRGNMEKSALFGLLAPKERLT
jgi:hypothetical protein